MEPPPPCGDGRCRARWHGCGWHGHRRLVGALEGVLRRLSQGNDLGTQPLSFMVASGTTAAQLAQQRGLCKPDACQFFAHLNPYRRYANGMELQADADAATMLARAGYPPRVCEQELAFMARSTGDGSRTEPDSSHPGYEERLAAASVTTALTTC